MNLNGFGLNNLRGGDVEDEGRRSQSWNGWFVGTRFKASAKEGV
jgi:hypothetical protein